MSKSVKICTILELAETSPLTDDLALLRVRQRALGPLRPGPAGWLRAAAIDTGCPGPARRSPNRAPTSQSSFSTVSKPIFASKYSVTRKMSICLQK